MSSKKLDNIEQIKKIDSQDMHRSLEEFALQAKQAWDEVSKIKLNFQRQKINNIVVAGMGGSALGARIIKSLYFDRLTVPFEIHSNYSSPAFVNKNTLFIASSYSGNTEETLSALSAARVKTKMLLVITSGGKLLKSAKKLKIPVYWIKPKHNPSGQPRMALAYSFSALLCFLKKVGLLNLDKLFLSQSISAVERNNKLLGIKVGIRSNAAKQLALKLKGKVPLLLGAAHLEGALHACRNQFNENSKSYGGFYTVPELNHHLLEGFSNPKLLQENFLIIAVLSRFASAKNVRRLNLTLEIAKKQGIAVAKVRLRAGSKTAEVFELLHYFGYVSFYLALVYGKDPSPIPWVDYFKKSLQT